MKKLLYLLLVSNVSLAQIFTESEITWAGSITILPRGIQGSLNSNLIPSNLAFGPNALKSNTSGNRNTAIGINALEKTTTATFNTAIGHSVLTKNIGGSSNTAVGHWSLYENTAGNGNSALGYYALHLNTVGIDNVALGSGALTYNTTGNYNTAVGYDCLYKMPSGEFNTAIGARAGQIMGGSKNTFVGAYAKEYASIGNLTNGTAIGYEAAVNASNKVRIGNHEVTVIEGQVPWSNTSDRRLKENILYTNRLGLDFISKLQTVSYNYIADRNKKRHDGFIAQDVEQIMKELGVPFSGLNKANDGTYSLAYSAFIMPLVNSVKEQQNQIEQLKKQNQALLTSIEDIKAELIQMKQQGSKTSSE